MVTLSLNTGWMFPASQAIYLQEAHLNSISFLLLLHKFFSFSPLGHQTGWTCLDFHTQGFLVPKFKAFDLNQKIMHVNVYDLEVNNLF